MDKGVVICRPASRKDNTDLAICDNYVIGCW